MTKTECQAKCSRTKPLRSMPRAAPPPAMPLHTAMAFGRSWAGKTLVRIDRVDGMIIAPARPMTARAAMRPAAVSAPKAAYPLARPKRRSPACMTPLRPNRSPIELVVNSSPAKTRE